MSDLTALIIDDDEAFRDSLELLVQREGFATRTAGSLAEARDRLVVARPDVALVDLGLPDGDGLAWLREEPAAQGVEVIVITGSSSVETAGAAARSTT
jgi:DNA-binding NtrC family response regulator